MQAEANIANNTTITQEEVSKYNAFITKLIKKLTEVIRGKGKLLNYLVTSLIAGGHVLIEDVPGLGKTTIAKTLARLISKKAYGLPVVFKRIQCTPDLLPYDITGVDIFDPKSKRFTFNKGPVFANILLVDEINRTTPKVQSALLEVMAENQVTVGKRTYKMAPLFFVIGTQNPVETEGTYPLPVAQIDRFFMKLSVGYPDQETEIGIVIDNPASKIMPKIKPVCGIKEILRIRKILEKIYCAQDLIQAVVGITAATRDNKGIELGASPRGSIMLIQAARAYALVSGRAYVIDQDILELAPLVLAHRLKIKDPRINPHQLIREFTIKELNKINYLKETV